MTFKVSVAGLMFAAAVLLQTGQAEATFSTVAVDDAVRVGGGLVGSNGEFTVYKDTFNATTGYLFDTFCVEHNQGLNLDVKYYVSSILLQSDKTREVSLGGGINFLEDKAAALYGAFAVQRNAETGGVQTSDYYLLGEKYNQTNGDSNSLQEAIWMLQYQIAVTGSNMLNKYYVAANAASTAAINAARAGVKILNISSTLNLPDGTNLGPLKQSQMYWVEPPPILGVPEPSSMVLFGLGIVVAGWSQRRRRSSVGSQSA